jgi:isochorismate synthase
MATLPPFADMAPMAAALRPVLQRATRRAAERRAAVLVRLHLTLADCDPWELWDAIQREDARGQTGNMVALHDGSGGLGAVGWGTLLRQRLRGSGRFDGARSICLRLLDQAYDVRLDSAEPPDADAPLAFVGFAFADAPQPSSAASPWAPWAAGQVFVPRNLIYRRLGAAAGPCRAVLSERVGASRPIGPLLDGLLKRLQALASGVAAWQGSRPATPATPATLATLATKGRPSASAAAAAAAPAAAVAGPVGCQVPVEAVQASGGESADAWCSRVRAAQQAAAAGGISKVVLARSLRLQAPEGQRFSPLQTAWALRRAHPQSICFLASDGRRAGSAFLGASPEHLVRVCGRQLFTQAVAGTAARDPHPATDRALGAALLASPKDGQEHALVADGLHADLLPLCVDLQRPTGPRLLRLPKVQHLETPFAGVLRQTGGILDLVERLHPTAAVGGWPRAAARRYLADHEPLDRGYYAGPVGWVTAASDGAFAVAIRSVLLQGATAHAYAGAGIVATSNPQAEWEETELKLRTVRDALRLVAQEAHPVAVSAAPAAAAVPAVLAVSVASSLPALLR